MEAADDAGKTMSRSRGRANRDVTTGPHYGRHTNLT